MQVNGNVYAPSIATMKDMPRLVGSFTWMTNVTQQPDHKCKTSLEKRLDRICQGLVMYS
jgi:hypothetical protein